MEEKIATLFYETFDLTPSSNGWMTFDCPYCDMGRSKRKCNVNLSGQQVKCWECGYKDSAISFIKDYFGFKTFKAVYQRLKGLAGTPIDLIQASFVPAAATHTVQLPYSFKNICEGDGIIHKRVTDYLSGRGFDLDALSGIGVGYCDEHTENKVESYFGRIVIPFKYRGRLQYYVGRDFMGSTLRYKNPNKDVFGVGKSEVLFNRDALDLYDEVFILEGWADAFTIGKQAISTQGWSMSREQVEMIISSPCKRLVFVPDVGYYEQALVQAIKFMERKEVFVLPMDCLEEYGKDVNEIGLAKVLGLYREQKPITFFDVVNNLIK